MYKLAYIVTRRPHWVVLRGGYTYKSRVRHCHGQQCKPIPPPKVHKESHTLLKVGAVAIVGTVGSIGYAHYDPDFRDLITDNIPYADDFFKFIFMENDSMSRMIEDLKKLLMDLFFGKEKKKKLSSKSEETEYRTPVAVVPIIEKEIKKPAELTYTEVRVADKPADEEEEPNTTTLDIGELKKPIESDHTPDLSITTVGELEQQLCTFTSDAVNAYNRAINIVQTYNDQVSVVVDHAANHEQMRPEIIDRIRKRTIEKNEAISATRERVEAAKNSIEKLTDMLNRADFDPAVPSATKEIVRLNIKKMQEDIEKARKQFERERKLGSVTEVYWDKVLKARQHFANELEQLFPTIDLSKKQLKIKEDDLDLFLSYVFGHVQFYQKELARMESVMQEKLGHAVDAARRGGGTVLTSVQICEAIEQEKRRMSLCFQQQCLKMRIEAQNEMREQLKRQSQAFSDHLEEAVRTRGAEIERTLARKFDEQLECEKNKYKMQLAMMVGRMKGIEQALSAKNAEDEISRKSQILWSACQSFIRAISTGCPGIDWQDQLRPLEPEIQAVREAAAESDELVAVVIHGIPAQARERGVFPREALRERFLKLEQVARTLALVPEDGASLPIYILSYLQSMFLVKAATPIPQSELDDEEMDFSHLNTNEILQRARYWLDRDDFAQALKYMNLLKGAPRTVAKQWMDETRLFLETSQAAETLMAHAASSGLIYL